MGTLIDITRCKELIRGHEPENVAEEMFLFCYKGALSGELIGDLILQMGDAYDKAGAFELEMTILGYSSGQKEKLIEFEAKTNTH